jgi:hypothetical protein
MDLCHLVNYGAKLGKDGAAASSSDLETASLLSGALFPLL